MEQLYGRPGITVWVVGVGVVVPASGGNLFNCVLEQKKPRTSGTKALLNLKLMEAIFRKYVRYDSPSSSDGSEWRTEVTS